MKIILFLVFWSKHEVSSTVSSKVIIILLKLDSKTPGTICLLHIQEHVPQRAVSRENFSQINPRNLSVR